MSCHVSINNHCKLLNVYVNVQKVFKLFKKTIILIIIFFFVILIPTLPFFNFVTKRTHNLTALKLVLDIEASITQRALQISALSVVYYALIIRLKGSSLFW